MKMAGKFSVGGDQRKGKMNDGEERMEINLTFM